MTPIPKPNVRMTPSVPEPPTGTVVVLALGSNLGDRARTLYAAVRSIAGIDGFELDAVSPLVESAALKPGGVDRHAPVYLNAVVTGYYAGGPHALLAAINRIEADNGRERTERWGDRTLDIDIIVFGDLQLSDETLTIPHPRAAERDFVLAPWLSIDADAVLPGRAAVADLLAATGNTVTPFGADSPGADSPGADSPGADSPGENLTDGTAR
jgi:2-amino-4-hydroxy-6-hydroxymethyldihydropteridine diphosphokinase